MALHLIYLKDLCAVKNLIASLGQLLGGRCPKDAAFFMSEQTFKLLNDNTDTEPAFGSL